MNIKFLKGLFAAYEALVTKDANTLYFITDTGALYLGDKLIGKDFNGDIDALEAFIGSLPAVPEGASYTTVIEYINWKAEEVLKAAQGGSSETAASVKLALDNYKAENDTRVKAIEDDYLKASDKTELEGKINNKVEKVEGYSLVADTEIARLAEVDNYDDSEVRGLINNKVDKVEGYSLVSDTEIARLANVDNYNDAEVRGLIDAVEEDIAEINNAENGILAQAKAYTDEVKAGILGEGITETYDTLVEIQNWINGAGVDATELTEAIAAETKNREDADAAINAKLEGIDTTVVAAINASLEAAKKYADEGDADTIYDDTALSNRVTAVEGKLEGLGENTVKGYVDAEIAKVDAAGVNSKISEIEEDVQALESGKVDKVEGYSLISDAEIARLKDVDNYDDTALAGRVKAIEDLGLVENYALKSEVKAVDDKLVNYVEKEGYIAYTQAEKDKLAGLNNYNDTEVRGLISGLDTRVGGVEGKLEGVSKVSESIATALAEAKKYADDHDDDTKYDDTEVRGLITSLDSEVDGIASRVGTIEAKPAMGITADNISAWNGKATLAEVKETYIGNTSVTLAAVVDAVNKLYDGSETVNGEIANMDQNVKALEGALTWGEIK